MVRRHGLHIVYQAEGGNERQDGGQQVDEESVTNLARINNMMHYQIN